MQLLERMAHRVEVQPRSWRFDSDLARIAEVVGVDPTNLAQVMYGRNMRRKKDGWLIMAGTLRITRPAAVSRACNASVSERGV
ncbi:MAG: hypothetical protein IVW55_00580 [Chloroflexi bacterium]|nr:hypothetical protein [Chloroflexota bacterium]